MPELLLELFSEEIPARMQARGADDLARLVAAALAPLAPADMRSFCGPRRIALACSLGAAVPMGSSMALGFDFSKFMSDFALTWLPVAFFARTQYSRAFRKSR